ncbi:hypothetical protein [Bacillus toyonensis]|uniref:hypothetical protein n=1 Tax=Bacillus toyonensis TaxID=155322 RepID=UPI001145AA60|nr:hypothetical protein [Bacillus toyonensis]
MLRKDRFKIVSCGCYAREGLHLVNKEPDQEQHIIKCLYNKLKSRQRKKGFKTIDMLNFEKFKELIKQPCFYCGLEKSNVTYDTVSYQYNYKLIEDFKKKRVSDFVLYHNGLDRIDSGIGYIDENVVPCCKYCNMAKMDRTKEDFLLWAEKVYQNYIILDKNK